MLCNQCMLHAVGATALKRQLHDSHPRLVGSAIIAIYCLRTLTHSVFLPVDILSFEGHCSSSGDFALFHSVLLNPCHMILRDLFPTHKVTGYNLVLHQLT